MMTANIDLLLNLRIQCLDVMQLIGWRAIGSNGTHTHISDSVFNCYILESGQIWSDKEGRITGVCSEVH